VSESLLSQTFALSLGKLLASLSTIVTTALLTRLLSVGEYADYRLMMMLFNLAVPALILGVPQALFVALAGERSGRQRAAVLEALCLLTLTGGLLALLALCSLEAFTVGLSAERRVALSLPLALLALSSMPKHALPPPLISLGRVKLLAVYQVVTQLISALLICLGAWLWASAEASLWSAALGAGISLLAGLKLAYQVLGRATERAQVTIMGVWALLCLGVPVGLARLFGTLSQQLDKYMVAQRFEPEAFAVYVTGAMELPAVTIVTGALSSVLLPRLAAHFKRGEYRDMGALWRGMIEKTSLLLLPMMWGTLCLGDELIDAIFPADYRAAAVPFKIYALLLPLKCAVYGSVLIASGRGLWVTLSSLSALLLNIILNLVFIEWIGIHGPAWATVVTAYLSTALLMIPLCKLFEVGVAQLAGWGALLKVSLISALPLPLLLALEGGLCSDWAALTRLLCLGSLYVLSVGALYLLTGLIKSPRALSPEP